LADSCAFDSEASVSNTVKKITSAVQSHSGFIVERNEKRLSRQTEHIKCEKRESGIAIVRGSQWIRSDELLNAVLECVSWNPF
jgi:hypothetical protein